MKTVKLFISHVKNDLVHEHQFTAREGMEVFFSNDKSIWSDKDRNGKVCDEKLEIKSINENSIIMKIVTQDFSKKAILNDNYIDFGKDFELKAGETVLISTNDSSEEYSITVENVFEED